MIAESLHCRACGYNLRGLQADGRCPECGMGIWESVAATVDPAGARLPSLRNPRAVGNGLVLLTIGMLICMLLLITPSIGSLLESWGAAQRVLEMIPSLTWPWATILILLCAWALRLLAPPRRSETNGAIWRDIWRIGVGLLGWIAFSTMWIEFQAATLGPRFGPAPKVVIHLTAAVFATIGLMGLRGVFRVIGLRSREYRRSQGGRQSVELLIFAISVGWVAELVHYSTRLGWFPGTWRADARVLATVVMWICSMMVLIGLGYLVVNAWWIRRSLRKPPPAFDQVLVPHLPPDTWIPDREE
jgi:hypothetical protein